MVARYLSVIVRVVCRVIGMSVVLWGGIYYGTVSECYSTGSVSGGSVCRWSCGGEWWHSE